MRFVLFITGAYFLVAWALMLLVDLTEAVWLTGIPTISYGGSLALLGGVAVIAGGFLLAQFVWGWLCGLGE